MTCGPRGPARVHRGRSVDASRIGDIDVVATSVDGRETEETAL
ncbi:hypothetical protein [Streptomyces sp. 2A115]